MPARWIASMAKPWAGGRFGQFWVRPIAALRLDGCHRGLPLSCQRAIKGADAALIAALSYSLVIMLIADMNRPGQGWVQC